MVVSEGFWRGKNVLVTGHTGFKGSWLSLWLQSLGAKVSGYALKPPTDPSLFCVARVADGMTGITGDVNDSERLQSVCREIRPEIVIHMAAQSLVRYSYANPVETYATNIMGLVHLLESLRPVPEVRAVVIVTSDKCYENREWVWGYREDDPMGGHDPYSSSKGCAELVTSAYRNSYFCDCDASLRVVGVATARAGNATGGGDWAHDRLIPDTMRAISRGEPVRIRNPDAVRPWQHVLEPLSGYLILAQRLYEGGSEFGEAWNFGPDDSDAKPVRWIIEHVTKAWGSGASWSPDEKSHPHEATHLKLDCSKARARLHWRPRWDLSQAIQRIVEWHKAFDAGDDMRKFTLDQIDAYQNQ